MGLFGHQNGVVRPEAKWDYIQLNDFKADGVLTYIAYGYLFVSLTISMAVYTVDTFTAVNLLAFNTWSSEIQPAIPFAITKWIFSVCIILSFVNVAYEHIRAQMIIRRGSVAESFLDNLAVRLQSVRILNGKGWRRFLVFAELTKSKKGAEYIALFTYFSFQAWIRIIFCSGPRQVVNAVTLYSVYTAKLEIDGTNFESSLESLFSKIKALAQQDYQQALILSGMLFTLIIWVFSALSFILACIFYVTFLWGWIPKQDGGLSGYCERKINKRLMSIVSKKVEAALADLEKQRKKAEMKAAKKAGALPPEERKATLPTLMPEKDDKTSDMPPLFRNDTVATLPVYTSRPGTPRGDQFELNNLPPMPTRTNTSITTSSRAPLLGASADMGVSTPTMPSPMYGPARSGTMNTARGPYAPGGPNRTMTGTSNYSGTMVPSGPKRSMTGNSNFSGSTMGPPQLSRIQTHDSSYSNASRGPQQLRRTQTANSGYSSSYGQAIYHSPDDDLPSMPAPVRSPTAVSNNYYGLPSRATPGPVSSYDDYYDRSTSAAPMSQIGARSEYGDYSSAGFPGAAPTRYMTPAPMYDEHAAGGRASPAPARQVNPRPTFNDFSATGRASPAPSKQMEPHLPFDDYASNGYASAAPSRPTHQRLPSDGYSATGRASAAPSGPSHQRVASDGYSATGRASPAPSGLTHQRQPSDGYSVVGRASPAPSRQTNRRSTYYSSTGPTSSISTHPNSHPMPSDQPSTPVNTRPAFSAYSPPSASAARGQGDYPSRSLTSQVAHEQSPAFSVPTRSMTAPVAQQHSRDNSAAIDPTYRPTTSHSQRGLAGTPPRQTGQSHYPRYGNAYSDLESQNGASGPRY